MVLPEYLLGLDRIRQLGVALLGAGALGLGGQAMMKTNGASFPKGFTGKIRIRVRCYDHQICQDVCTERFATDGICDGVFCVCGHLPKDKKAKGEDDLDSDESR